jgi:hypothetical protein
LTEHDWKESAVVEAVATRTRLLIVREIQEDDSGAALHFQQGGHGRLAVGDPNYAAYLRLARRSKERQHPVGVSFAKAHTITELIRADNDVPSQLSEEAADRMRVFFQGHDGVFRLKPDHSESTRIRALLCEALRQKARVWFIAQKPDLALLDVLPAGWAASASQTGDGSGSAQTFKFVGGPLDGLSFDPLTTVDRNGAACNFEVRITKDQFADIWNFEVYSIPRRPDKDFFPMSLELQDDDTLRIIAIGGNTNNGTWPEYSAKGIPLALLTYAYAQLGKTIVSSPSQGRAGVWRTPKATAMWKRIVAAGHADYDPIADIYTFVP